MDRVERENIPVVAPNDDDASLENRQGGLRGGSEGRGESKVGLLGCYLRQKYIVNLSSFISLGIVPLKA